MKPIENFEAKKAMTTTCLPAGGYIAKVIGAEVQSYSWGEVLHITFDIAEGEHAGFFQDLYTNSDYADVKWKGKYRLNIPTEGDQYYVSQKKAFANAIWAIEASNQGYHWDWNEMTLAGKQIGVIFRNREYEMEGRRGWTTECVSFASVEDIKLGNFSIPKDKALPQTPLNMAKAVGEELASDEDLPF